MKKWRCLVCGYIHEGENPPANCPVCGAPHDMFVPADDGQAAAVAKASDATDADILVVGSGGAAFAAAITARSKGASVIMLEKAVGIGGTTARSGGGFWVPNNIHQRELGIKDNKQDCLAYVARYSYPQLFNPAAKRFGLPEHEYELIEAYYDNAYKMHEYLLQLGALESMVEINWTGKPQVDYMDHLPENKGIRGRSIYPKGEDGKMGMGYELVRQLHGWARDNGVTIISNCEVTEILTDSTGMVTGLKARAGSREKKFMAFKGVVFGSGGYTHNDGLMLSWQRGPHFGGCSVPTNNGDFIRMAGRIGARMGNTAGAFRAQSMLEAALENPGGSSNVFYIAGDSVIIVNKYGKRFVDEKRNYTDRTMTHFVWDPQKAEWTNMFGFMIFDERTARLWQGFPPYPVQGDEMPYLIKADDLDGLEQQLMQRLDSIKGSIGGFTLAPSFGDGLKHTLSRYNDFARKGRDEDFNRGEFDYDREWTSFPPTIPGVDWPENDNYTMYPIADKGPYYAIILAAGTLDTNGGPVVDGNARVLDWNGKPIRGLYGAGNCIASPTANAYWGAGSTIGPAMTFGYLAALHALEGN